MQLTSLLTRQIIVPALAASLVSAGAAGFAGWTVRGWRCDAALLKTKTALQKAQDLLDDNVLAASVSYEQGRGDGLKEAGVRQNTIREVYRNVKVPAECEPPASVGGVLEAGVAAANARASGKPAATVRGPAGAAASAS